MADRPQQHPRPRPVGRGRKADRDHTLLGNATHATLQPGQAKP